MSGAYARRKGHSFERWVANRLKELDPTARRNVEETQCASVDIKTRLPLGFQLKSLGRWSLTPHSVFEQAKGGCSPEQEPVCVVKITHKEPILAFVDFEFLLKLLGKYYGHKA